MILQGTCYYPESQEAESWRLVPETQVTEKDARVPLPPAAPQEGSSVTSLCMVLCMGLLPGKGTYKGWIDG